LREITNCGEKYKLSKKEENFTKKWGSNKNQKGVFGTDCGEG
jgi:hypothetical protein